MHRKWPIVLLGIILLVTVVALGIYRTGMHPDGKLPGIYFIAIIGSLIVIIYPFFTKDKFFHKRIRLKRK